MSITITFTKDEIREIENDIRLADIGDGSGYTHLGYMLKEKLKEQGIE